jgi:quinol monooxygenase YgiN
MSYVVAIRIQLDGDPENFKEMIMQYREDCLSNESGMEHFFICSVPDDERSFLLMEGFSDHEAHQLHSKGKDLQKLIQSMEENNMRMEVMMMGGNEIESEERPVLN